MNEFNIIKKYLRPLSKKNLGSFALSDDIYYYHKKQIAVSMDTYVEGVHFIKSSEPNKVFKKILRASLSDLYCKGIIPNSYFLSLALSKKEANDLWLRKMKNTLNLEQKKFNILLGGGDTTFSSKLVITITVIGFSKKKPVLRKGSNFNDDIYVTGNLGDSFIGLSIIKKKISIGKYNSFFTKKYYEPNLPIKISPFLKSIASSSIDISDGLGQDLQHLCDASGYGAYIDLVKLPLSHQCKYLILKNKFKLENIFSKGDDYQILFTSNKNSRSKIKNLSKKLNLKISRIGKITNNRNIFFKHKKEKFKLSATKMGYIHTF